MPFLDLRTTVPVPADRREALKSAFGQAITTLHKTETYLMVSIQDGCDLWLGGRRLDQGAYIALSLYGSASPADYDRMTGQLCRILSDQLGIPAQSVYVTYHPVSDWGWNGRNFRPPCPTRPAFPGRKGGAFLRPGPGRRGPAGLFPHWFFRSCASFHLSVIFTKISRKIISSTQKISLQRGEICDIIIEKRIVFCTRSIAAGMGSLLFLFPGRQKEADKMAKIETRLFGFTHSGTPVNEYILSNPGGLSVSVLDYGAIIKNIIVPAKRGPVDVVLGHDTMQEYELDTATYCGAFVGRYANRIEGAAFTLNGKTYQLEANNGRNHLHGCFARKSYEVKAFGDTLLLEAESPDGEEGFPGTMKIAVRYTLTPDNAFRMDYRVSSDADTIVNLTNHTYFNLNGAGSILNQRLKLFASTYLEGNEETCPTGRILPVAGTPMDFTKGKAIGRDLNPGSDQTRMVGDGYDHCFVIDRPRAGARQSICAWATCDESSISMKVYTTQPGVHLYTGNFLQDCPSPGKGLHPMQKYGGFALETEHFPCSPSHPEFPTTVLRAGKVFRVSNTLRFFTGKQCGVI